MPCYGFNTFLKTKCPVTFFIFWKKSCILNICVNQSDKIHKKLTVNSSQYVFFLSTVLKLKKKEGKLCLGSLIICTGIWLFANKLFSTLIVTCILRILFNLNLNIIIVGCITHLLQNVKNIYIFLIRLVYTTRVIIFWIIKRVVL